MTSSTYIKGSLRPRTDLGIEQVEDDLLILDKHGQKIHKLNPMASLIWARLEKGQEPNQIAQAIAEIFEISSEMALKDVTRTLDEFRALNLLENESVL